MVEQDGNLVIYVNSRLPIARRRFTIAHEIGHTYFTKKRPDSVGLAETRFGCQTEFAQNSSSIEALCDIFGVELLMPLPAATKIIRTGFPSIRCIRELCSTFNVSIAAAAWRLAEIAPVDVTIIWCREMAKPTDAKDIKLRLDWGVSPRQDRLYLPRFDAVPHESLISSCYYSRLPAEGFEKLDFGSLRGSRYLVCERFGNRVLCLVLLDASPANPRGQRPGTLFV
ncbi:MAG: ImmA/IrrE family metallo-endopeptidase [Chloroflexi bacterium]|nr:ImmA/IrrE family metallo-endopeptidase [Chloroflexota bacterium]